MSAPLKRGLAIETTKSPGICFGQYLRNVNMTISTLRQTKILGLAKYL